MLDADSMAPSTLDLLVLTFNCAKSFINTSVFAHHLHTVLTTNATGLPDVVVLLAYSTNFHGTTLLTDLKLTAGGSPP